MIYTAILLLAICLTGCSLRSTYPTLGAIAGGGAGGSVNDQGSDGSLDGTIIGATFDDTDAP